MIDFEFVSPTKIYFGKGKEEKIGDILQDYGFKKIAIVIGQGHVIKSGLLDRVINKISEKGISYFVYKGVRPNPTIKECHELIDLLKKENPEMILAVGGGSVIDVSKNAACGYYYDGDSFDFNLHKVTPKKTLPIGVILTIAAAGSEMSASSVIQNDELQIKNGFLSDLNRPLFVIENPELTIGLPKEQLANGIVDIMMHTMERYFSKSDDNEPADRFAEGVLKSVIKAAKIAFVDEKDYDSRAVLMLMSSLSHNGLTSIGKNMAMPVHQLEHAISGVFPEVAHGRGLALLFPKWAKYYAKIDTAKFAQFGREIFDLNIKDDYECAYKGIEELEKFYEFLEMPKTFSDLNLKNVDTYQLAKICTLNNTRPVPHFIKKLDIDETKAIYDLCI